MKLDIIDLLSQQTIQDRQRFFVSLCNNITLSIRELSADKSDVQESERLILLLNEGNHRILNHVLNLYGEKPIWSDKDIFKFLKSLSENNKNVMGYVGSAISLTTLVKNFEAKGTK